MQFNRTRFSILAITFVTVLLCTVIGNTQYYKSQLQPPPPSDPVISSATGNDSTAMHSPVQPTVPVTADDYLGNKEYAADLRDPSNIKTEAVYDPATGMYVLRTRLGDKDIVTPYMMTPEEYNDMMTGTAFI